MFRKSPTILVAGCGAALLLAVSACGQKGDLLLPADKAAEAARLAQPRPAPAPAAAAVTPAAPAARASTAPALPPLPTASRQP